MFFEQLPFGSGRDWSTNVPVGHSTNRDGDVSHFTGFAEAKGSARQ